MPAGVIVVVVDNGFIGVSVAVRAATEAVEERLHALERHLSHGDTGCGLERTAKKTASTRGVGGLGVCRRVGRSVGRRIAGIVHLLVLRLLRVSRTAEDLAEEAAAALLDVLPRFVECGLQ